VVAVTLGSTAPARAALCGTVSGDATDNKIVLGEAASYFWYDGQYWYYGIGRLRACVSDAGGFDSTDLTGCTSTTSATDQVFVTAGAGDDQMAPNTETQACTLGVYMLAWNPGVLKFGIAANMGTGSDVAHGSENDDSLFSNYPGTVFPSNLTPADSADDILCGWGGDDSLTGDKDDSASFEELLGGGSGTDHCNGGNDGNTFDDVHGCESSSAASAGPNPCGASVPDLLPWPGV
jgi:hypothetical protein